jgi:DNA-directed RNA polymerase subunit RPC12/RpoP
MRMYYMDKNNCPYCGERISNWKKWQLTDNRYGKKCPHCNNIIKLPKTYVRFIQIFNIAAALVLVAISYTFERNGTLFLGLSALMLIPLNILLLQIPYIKRNDE